MRVLWCSLGDWFRPERADIEVISVRHDTLDTELQQATDQEYWFFFEPTPQPGWPYDPLTVAENLARVSVRRPKRLIAFVSKPSPTPWETQCAFAVQVGLILDVTVHIQRVEIRTRRSSSNGQNKDAKSPDDFGPRVDWGRALTDATAISPDSVESLSEEIIRFAMSYLLRGRGQGGFSVLQRELLHKVACGEAAVAAEDLARVLHRQRGTIQKAIIGLTPALSDNGSANGAERRTGPAEVARLAYQYGWFLQHNRP